MLLTDEEREELNSMEESDLDASIAFDVSLFAFDSSDISIIVSLPIDAIGFAFEMSDVAFDVSDVAFGVCDITST